MNGKPPLPLREGVSASCVVLPQGGGLRVLDFLCAHFPDIAESEWLSRMQRGLVVDSGGHAITAQTAYRAGAEIHYYRELAAEQEIPFEAGVLYRDEHLLVADKPHFLPVIPAGKFLRETLLVRLKKQFGLADLVPLHRIDRGTAGVVVFSSNPQTRGRYQSLFPQREVSKTYEALAPSLPDLPFPMTRRTRLVEGTPFFRMQEVEGPPNTETLIELQEVRGAISLYRLSPVTGRKHQLRLHLAGLGAPILNDAFYPRLRPEIENDFTRPLQLLARSIAFTDPLSGEPRRFESRRQLHAG